MREIYVQSNMTDSTNERTEYMYLDRSSFPVDFMNIYTSEEQKRFIWKLFRYYSDVFSTSHFDTVHTDTITPPNFYFFGDFSWEVDAHNFYEM